MKVMTKIKVVFKIFENIKMFLKALKNFKSFYKEASKVSSVKFGSIQNYFTKL